MSEDQSSEPERTLRRTAELTTFLNSRTLERIAVCQKNIGSIGDSSELLDLHNSLDLSQEQSPLSPTTELYYLLKAELAFAHLRNPAGASFPIDDALEQISAYGELRRQQIQDPTTWLQYQILSGMYALQRNRKSDAESHLREFEQFTKPFNVPADVEYVTQMRRHIAEGDTERAREVFSKRLGIFFPQVFAEVKEALERKIEIMKGMI
jgi:hypothetical protein